MKVGTLAVVTEKRGPNGIHNTTHMFRIGERIQLRRVWHTTEGTEVYDFKDESGLEQTLFRNQFEWLSEVVQ